MSTKNVFIIVGGILILVAMVMIYFRSHTQTPKTGVYSSHMSINFFEEYPTPENMSKLAFVTSPATVLVAAPSFSEFEKIRTTYSLQYPHITFGWWPTIPGSYWVSGISNSDDLDRLFNELINRPNQSELSVLLDLEVPLKPWKYFKNIVHMRSNKNKITQFIKEAPSHNLKVYTAEYPATNKVLHAFWRWLGLSPRFDLPHTKLRMNYTSMGEQMFGKNILNRIKKYEQGFAQDNPGRVGFGLGTIATGVLGNEAILSPEGLKEDLEWAKKAGVSEVFIFRLGGLNAEYAKVINESNI